MILLIDNYDSFTYNLYHQIGQQYETIKIVRNDQMTIEEIRALAPRAIVLSPGPGTPSDAGICIEVIRNFYKEIPILGVCLGHQAIGEAFNGAVVRANKIIHGKTSFVQYEKSGLFSQITGAVEVMRYHSLVIQRNTLPAEIIIDAVSYDDDEIMALHHRDYPLFGVQFHPESIGTERGDELIRTFLQMIV